MVRYSRAISIMMACQVMSVYYFPMILHYDCVSLISLTENVCFHLTCDSLLHMGECLLVVFTLVVKHVVTH